MQGHLQPLAELLQVVGRSLVADILHPHMNSLDAKPRVMNLRPAPQQLGEQQRILAAREPYQHMVIVGQQLIPHESLDKPFVQPLEQHLLLALHTTLFL